jgi:hypothetical protein
MTKRLRLLTVLCVLVVVGVLATVFHPQAEEVGDNEPPSISESDLQLYIKVYSAMQEDHDLTIDSAIKSHDISLDDFRQLERRIQAQSRMVERVRQALLEQVKANSTFALATATPTPPAHQGKAETQRKTKKQ